jgi:hypothetical protein
MLNNCSHTMFVQIHFMTKILSIAGKGLNLALFAHLHQTSMLTMQMSVQKLKSVMH